MEFNGFKWRGTVKHLQVGKWQCVTADGKVKAVTEYRQRYSDTRKIINGWICDSKFAKSQLLYAGSYKAIVLKSV